MTMAAAVPLPITSATVKAAPPGRAYQSYRSPPTSRDGRQQPAMSYPGSSGVV